jgi:two-component system CheB/CheR fusion protein
MLDGEHDGRLRILVVDDCPDHTDTLAFLLKLWGHEVRTAANGPTALAVAPGYLPDVVLLDVGMPGMDGFEVARHLRRQEGLAATAIIALSGYAQDEDRRHAREAGCDDHLAKPVDLVVLRNLLAGHKQARGRPAAGAPREEGGSGP